MEKRRKLRSSIKALHDALTSFRPAVGAPMCIQPAKTHSFRDLLTSFNSVYYAPPTSSISSASFSDHCSHCSFLNYPQSLPSAEVSSTYKGEVEEEEAISVSATTSGSSTCSSCLTSSSLAVAAAPPNDKKKAEAEAETEAEAFPSGSISSERFFFSPCTSKSIMGESFREMGSKRMDPLRGGLLSKPEGTEEYQDEDDVFAMLLEREVEAVSEGTRTTGMSALCRESIPMAIASRDPYRDFRSSMEEMVAAHGLRDWPGLQELLYCYLRLNEKKTHKFIVMAFKDLLTHLA